MSMRIRIMKAIYHSPATAEEISEITGDDRKKIVSNMGSVCSEGLVKRIVGIDGMVEYKITETGKTYYQRNAPKALGESANLEMEIPEALPPVPEVDSGEEAGPAEEAEEAIELVSIDPPEQDSSAPEPVETIEPIPDEGPLYAIYGSAMAYPELAGPTLSDAQQQAISLAYDCGADLQLYRLVPVGRTTTTVVFVES